MTLNPPFNAVIEALSQRRFFKLICGGSFSDPIRLKQLIQTYSKTAISAIDISAALPVVEAAIEALETCAKSPLLMVSFPLDTDPHFRKIELIEENCIQCGHCIPICPTQTFSLPPQQTLQVDTPVCYGCGRCLPICPTEALALDPYTVYPDLTTVLKKPAVNAVEIHTSHADPVMIETLYAELGDLLADKMISVCLRPQELPLKQVLSFLETLKAKTPFPLIVQVDGIPMSGSDDPTASLPALRAAQNLAPFLPPNCILTISGGINAFTASYLQQPEYHRIQGVGMGTYARQKVWDLLGHQEQAIQIADSLVNLFQTTSTSAIITV